MAKPVLRIPDEDLPPYQCNHCWFYEPVELDHGACYGVPPAALLDPEGDLICPRIMVLPEDRGCHLFKPRHSA